MQKLTLEKFKKILEKAIKDTGEFEAYTNKDIGFSEQLEANEIVVIGEEDQPTFTLTITQVD